jgi:hypothetical protein
MNSRCEINHVPKGIRKTRRTALPFAERLQATAAMSLLLPEVIENDACDDIICAKKSKAGDEAGTASCAQSVINGCGTSLREQADRHKRIGTS